MNSNSEYYNDNPKLQKAIEDYEAAELFYDNLPLDVSDGIYQSAVFGLQAAKLYLSEVIKGEKNFVH